MIAAQPKTVLRAMLVLLVASLLLAGGLAAAATPTAGPSTVYLPRLVVPGTPPTSTPPTSTPPTSTPPRTSLPAELVGTWYNGKLLSGQFYDPNTNSWQDPGGIAHSYRFAADGSYSLASYLELNSGSFCTSRVWKYQTGTVTADGQRLLVAPSYARTRTRIDCGSHSDSETEGPYTTTAVPWQLSEDENGHTRLLLTEGENTISYFKDGVAVQILGTWRRGDVQPLGFYDPTTGQWASPDGPGEWYEFNGDGTYRYGGLLIGYASDGCEVAMLVYQEGLLRGSGATITTEASAGARRGINLCDPSQVVDEQWTDPDLGQFTWSLLSQDGAPALQLLRLLPFQQRLFTRAE